MQRGGAGRWRREEETQGGETPSRINTVGHQTNKQWCKIEEKRMDMWIWTSWLVYLLIFILQNISLYIYQKYQTLCACPPVWWEQQCQKSNVYGQKCLSYRNQSHGRLRKAKLVLIFEQKTFAKKTSMQSKSKIIDKFDEKLEKCGRNMVLERGTPPRAVKP